MSRAMSSRSSTRNSRNASDMMFLLGIVVSGEQLVVSEERLSLLHALLTTDHGPLPRRHGQSEEMTLARLRPDAEGAATRTEQFPGQDPVQTVTRRDWGNH